MTTPAHNISLLRTQMKLQLNAALQPFTPGDYLKFAKQAFQILQQCTASDASTWRDCSRIIIQYIQCLNNVNCEFAAKGTEPKHPSMMLHGFFLCDLQQYDPKWMDEMVKSYPQAFMYLGQEWCAWTTLLK